MWRLLLFMQLLSLFLQYKARTSKILGELKTKADNTKNLEDNVQKLTQQKQE
jgi:hypothetical protein